MAPRKYVFKGQELPNPGNDVSIEDVKKMYQKKHPELTNAAYESKGVKDGKEIIEFSVSTGNKG